MGALFQDVRYTLRSLRKNPGFTAVAVLTMALGMGSVTIMFSVLDGVLLRPLPVKDQARVMVAWKIDPTAQFPHVPFSHPAFRAIREQSRSFERLAAVDYSGPWPFTVNQRDAPMLVKGGVISGDFFGVLDVKPTLGRALRPDDDTPGGRRVLVISHAFWKHRFGSDPGVVGHTLELWGERYQIIGVMAPGFEYPAGSALWVPSALLRPQWEEDHEYWNLDLVGRLKPGIQPNQALAELNTINRRLEISDPQGGGGYHVVARPFLDVIVGGVAAEIWVLSCAATLVMLISGANVTGLLLVRGASRRQEFSIRAAMGAGRKRLARQTLTEATIIVLLGGAVALGVVELSLHGLRAAVAPMLPRSEEVEISMRVLGFTLFASLVTVMFLAAMPVFRFAETDLSGQMIGGRISRESWTRRSGGRLLVVAQVAFALLVLAGAGLLVRSLSRLQLLDLGFDPAGLVTMQLALPPLGDNPSLPTIRDMIDRAVARIRALPGVSGATPVLVPAFAGNAGYDMAYTAEGQNHREAATNPLVNYEAAAPDYFRTLDIRLIKGRVVSEHDREDAAPVVVINEVMARQAWPGEDPIGRRLKWGGPDDEDPWRTVVGVVGSTRYRELTALRPTAYVPYRQTSQVLVHVVVRSHLKGGDIVPAVRLALRQANIGPTIVDATTMAERLSGPLGRPRFVAMLLSLFAGLALLLAIVGLYGVIASMVVQRTREIGVRLALGAQPGAIRWLVLRQGLFLVMAGMAAGLALSMAATRLLASMLYEVSPLDMPALVGAASVLLLVSLAASYIPARRASQVDPIMSLRAE